MQKHSLELYDFHDDNYTLIGIHSTLEDYKLAYVLNQELKTRFVRANYSLDFGDNLNNATFCIFEFINEKYVHNWFLISNKFTNSEENTLSLFQTNQITSYLIPEKKKVDFFLKLEGDFDSDYINQTVEKIKSINQIITSYTLDPNTLKSKDFLIF